VIPALIRKCIEASERGGDHIVCMGDGSQTRECFYVENAAEGILLASALYDRSDPVNLGEQAEAPFDEGLRKVIAWYVSSMTLTASRSRSVIT
jgi:nucleoside-diphosphate-sugar epimerase